MFLIEKIDKLILLTIEGQLTKDDVNKVKLKLNELIKINDQIVLSIDFSYISEQRENFDEETNINEILEFCNNTGIRVHFYRFS